MDTPDLVSWRRHQQAKLPYVELFSWLNSEESFIGDEEPKKVDDDEGKPYQGKILITRYQPSLNATHNASIATVNALQEPGTYFCAVVIF